MSDSEPSAELVVSIVDSADTAAVSTGFVKQRLAHQHGVETEYSELMDFLNTLVEDGVLQYHLGEYGEYAVPD